MIKLTKEYGIDVLADNTEKSNAPCSPLFISFLFGLTPFSCSPECDIWSSSLRKELHQPENEPFDLTPYLMSVVKSANMPENLHWLPKEVQMISISSSMIRYMRLHRKIFGKYTYTLPPCPSDEDLKSFDMPFGDFLKHNGLENLIPLLALGHTAQGYGFLTTVPAFYGLWWNTPSFLISLLKKQSLAQMLKPGFQTLWKTIAQKDELKIIYNASVTSINRNLDARDKPVIVEVLVEGEPQTMEFDFVITTIPLTSPSVNMFSDLTAEEREIFGALRSATLCTALYRADIFNQKEKGIQFYPERQKPEFEGRFYSERISAKALDPDLPNQSWHVSVAYQYMATHDPEGIEENKAVMLKDLADLGYKEIELLRYYKFEYFPKFSMEAIQKKYPWKALDLQGRNRAWFAGSSLCFESSEDVACYNHLLFQIHNMEEEDVSLAA